MEFKIKVIAVEQKQGTTKTNKPYQLAELAYRDLSTDKVTARKVTEYNGAFNTLKNSTPNQVYLISASKKEGASNWDWDKATLDSEDASGKSQMPATATSVAGNESAPAKSGAYTTPKSTFATAEERAATQAVINRSAALARGIEFLAAVSKDAFTVADVIDVAEGFVKYIVNGKPVVGKPHSFHEMKDDTVD